MDPEDEAIGTLVEHNKASKEQEELNQKNYNGFQPPSSVERGEGTHDTSDSYTYKSGFKIELIIE